MTDPRKNNQTAVLVTGAAGFLGQEVARRARAAGLRVRVTDRRQGALPKGLDFRSADVALPATLRGLFDGVDCVIHAAGLAHIHGKSQTAAAPFHAVNAIGAANVARAAADSGVPALVLISSVSVYGPHEERLIDESFPCRPDGPYAESKRQAEQLTTEIAGAAGMRLTILRLATLYGEYDPGNVAKLFRAIDRKRFIWIGDGSNQKSLLHRDDAARACIAAAVRPCQGVQTYNVAAPPCTMRQIVETIAGALSRTLPPWRIPAGIALTAGRAAGILPFGRARFGDLRGMLRKWLADDAYCARRFETDFDFRTEIALSEGIRREALSYRAASRVAA